MSFQREAKTISLMIRLYCHDHHHSQEERCADCARLEDYALRRLERCIFGEGKPTCANCVVQCYSKKHQQTIRQVMRYAGPRMMLKHPILALMHLIDGKRKPPSLASVVKEGKSFKTRKEG
jgi:hypothetical protein